MKNAPWGLRGEESLREIESEDKYGMNKRSSKV
jgi:hypothetical protein